MAVSATTAVLAAIAAVTERIRLASAVTILSTADLVAVFPLAEEARKVAAVVRQLKAEGERCAGGSRTSPFCAAWIWGPKRAGTSYTTHRAG